MRGASAMRSRVDASATMARVMLVIRLMFPGFASAALDACVLGIVTRDAQNFRDLKAYLSRQGCVLRGTSVLDGAEGILRNADAILFYPDEFEPSSAVRAALELRRRLPRAPLIVVTSNPVLLVALDRVATRYGQLFIIPRPAQGAAIVATIRSVLGRIENLS